ncbi:hypothetical protein AZE42_12430 [Rhizopogon vesiculosus]|uniref:Uncharacterized protein n=1 Tax=Rhizopogon vesiculosus TaxID=180088 RepID=A0A1J8QHW6_9AGAM|nr:hypothetical protein AZE42_12430 [Rhizopogon vesiculosus]
MFFEGSRPSPSTSICKLEGEARGGGGGSGAMETVGVGNEEGSEMVLNKVGREAKKVRDMVYYHPSPWVGM